MKRFVTERCNNCINLKTNPHKCFLFQISQFTCTEILPPPRYNLLIIWSRIFPKGLFRPYIYLHMNISHALTKIAIIVIIVADKLTPVLKQYNII